MSSGWTLRFLIDRSFVKFSEYGFSFVVFLSFDKRNESNGAVSCSFSSRPLGMVPDITSTDELLLRSLAKGISSSLPILSKSFVTPKGS